MKIKKIIAVAAAVAAGYIIVRDKTKKETVKWLVNEQVFNDYHESDEVTIFIWD